jgi:hypothetical protein
MLPVIDVEVELGSAPEQLDFSGVLRKKIPQIPMPFDHGYHHRDLWVR